MSGIVDWLSSQFLSFGLGAVFVGMAWLVATRFTARKDAREERAEKRAERTENRNAHEAHANAWMGAHDGTLREAESLRRQLAAAESEKQTAKDQAEQLRRQFEMWMNARDQVAEAWGARFFSLASAVVSVYARIDRATRATDRDLADMRRDYLSIVDVAELDVPAVLDRNVDSLDDEFATKKVVALLLEHSASAARLAQYRMLHHFNVVGSIVRLAVAHPETGGAAFLALAKPVIEADESAGPAFTADRHSGDPPEPDPP